MIHDKEHKWQHIRSIRFPDELWEAWIKKHEKNAHKRIRELMLKDLQST